MGTAMTCDKNGFAFEMVHHPDDDSSLNNTIDGSCEVFDIKDEKILALKTDLVIDSVKEVEGKERATDLDVGLDVVAKVDGLKQDQRHAKETNETKTLALKTDLDIGSVKEVEGKERAMDLDVDLDVVAKVDRLKQDQHHAKETNETHTGEEYPQNAVLATEYKELELSVTGALKEGSKVHDKVEAGDMTCDKNDFEVEMVTHPEDNSALNDTIIRGCDLVDTTIEDATNDKMDLCKAVISDKNDFEFEMVNHPEAEDDSTFNNTTTGSFELLDTTIEDAIDNKKTLASTLDLVISLMREVESKEKTAEQAKEERAKSGLDILAKVDELQQAYQHAKETNDMHARNVSAKKAILTTDIKDLQSCVSGLLNEGSKLLRVLDEICRALEMRLASATREKELADKAKLEKESLAQKSLAYEESQMIKVVEESERLTQDAVKISKLQEFLIDRRQVVDMLRNDISDKCLHVNSLKELLDQEVMQSGLFSSSQLSSILASIIPSYEQQLKKDELTETRKDWAEPADFPVFSDCLDKHVPLANQKQMKNGKSASVVILEDEMLSEIPALDLEKMEGNKNGSSETDINNEPAAADITVVGRSMSAEEFVFSAETNAKRVALKSMVPPKDYGKKSRGKKRKYRKMSGWGTVPRRIGCAGDPRGYF